MGGRSRPAEGPRVRGSGGVEIATYHYGGEGPPLLLAHATGFHGRCWARFAAELTTSFDVWSWDSRGHGASGKAPEGRYDDWTVFVDDLLAVLDYLDGVAVREPGPAMTGRWRAFGHSMGGGVILRAEHHRPGIFESICCYEPVVFPPGTFSADSERPVPLGEVARRRRSSFASQRAARDNFAAKPPFSKFDPAALDAYVAYGFIDAPDGGVVLACSPGDEASTYEGARSSQAWEELASIECPVWVFGGEDAHDPVSRIAGLIAAQLPRGSAQQIPGLGHFGPLEDPANIAERVAKALEGDHPRRHWL